jgi:hypothetical protein
MWMEINPNGWVQRAEAKRDKEIKEGTRCPHCAEAIKPGGKGWVK